MKEIPAGYTQTLTITVTHEMTVNFDELGPLHPVYATYWMAKHFEEAGRKIILPFLEEGEGGIGSEVSVTHTASALPGMQVTVTAVFERREGRRIYARMSAVNELGDLIGHGATTQVVLPQSRIDENFAQLAQRFEEYRAGR
ncbi:thioesterase family protein [Deinococcus peraridilitoris]|uniref:Putative thioesterase n=1 Tax=Deinococcus peraridilitoris (strain DSM 19664 / LMG 22246 / CIP 109416 / KR-200) TaxID=937777 RepID=K9ZXJ5_DEIPD|nr:thioesterase family protein [Deinococcus peraridilitoris]AFZ66388.1 putative thioesterase [Deinococcus peraridilitoris DSM 19664]